LVLQTRHLNIPSRRSHPIETHITEPKHHLRIALIDLAEQNELEHNTLDM